MLVTWVDFVLVSTKANLKVIIKLPTKDLNSFIHEVYKGSNLNNIIRKYILFDLKK